MIPPTPTPIPMGTPIPIDLNVSMWQLAPNAVGLWNVFGDYTPVVQIIFVGGLLIFMFWTIARLMRGISEEEA